MLLISIHVYKCLVPTKDLNIRINYNNVINYNNNVIKKYGEKIMGRKQKFGVETKPYTVRLPPSIENIIPASYNNIGSWLWDLANNQVQDHGITQQQKNTITFFYQLFANLIIEGKLDKELTPELKDHAKIFREMTV